MVLAYLADNTQTIPNAYYESIDDAISTAYQMGSTNGAANSTIGNIQVSYTIQHTHGAYCKKTASFIRDGVSSAGTMDGHTEYAASGHCSACGRSFSSGWRSSSTYEREGANYLYGIALQNYNNHLTGEGCPYAANICGITELTRTETDASKIIGGDKVISATITY